MSRLIKLLEMGLDMTRAELGQVKFRASTISDPHIRMLVNEVAKRTGIPTAALDAELSEEIKKIDEMKQYSQLLYETAARNAVENAAFDLIGTDDFSKEQFDINVFVKLCNIIQQEHESFFPLRAPGDTNYIFSITPIIVPSTKDVFKKYNNIKTAAATEGGDFIFNRDFMQKLLNWATMEHAKPNGLKYVSNGGVIPDCYCYIEFLIMHELLHYAYGDMARSKKLKQYKHSTHNQAMDFRINYLLVKSGYSQLPIGLFSDYINYDRQTSYEDMVRIVHEELQKLPKPLQDTYQKIADQMDDHSQSGRATPGSSEAEEQATNNVGDEELPDNPDDPMPSEEEIQKSIEDKLGKKQEESGKDGGGDSKFDPNSRGNGGPGTGGSLDDMTDISDLIKLQKPKYNWRALMKLLIQSATSHEEPSYTKPHRRAATGITVAAALGAGAIKPGNKTLQEPTLDLVLVIDTSGSMGHHIPLVLAEAKSLLKAAGKSNRSIMVVFFAGEDRYFKVNIGKNSYAEVTTVDEFLDKDMPKDAETGADNVFNKAGSGGTDFSKKLVNNLDLLAGKKYNIIIFSDGDLLVGENFNNLSNLWLKHKKSNNVCYIADCKETWVNACKAIGQMPATWTHI